MKRSHVLISGIGIAGPALAYWLVRRGFRCTLVERAPRLREGGQAVDFRGPVHRAVLERMDLWDAIHERRTPASGLVMLDRQGRPAATLPAFVISGDVEILRGDLSALLYDRICSDVDARFGDAISSLEQTESGVDVLFESGKAERFDLVIGAEGLHSRVRTLAFREGSHSIVHHGYRVLGFSAANPLDLDGRSLLYSLPGRGVLVSASSALFVFTGAPLDRGERDVAVAKREIARRFGNDGWHVPRLIAELGRASDPYFDTIGSVRAERYSTGRVALVGDSAWGGTLGGQGTSVAIIGAYVLAGELERAAGDHTAAFAAYETRMRLFATNCQSGAKRAGMFMAPRTRLGGYLRNLSHAALTSRLLLPFFEKLVKGSASDFELPDYREPSETPRAMSVAARGESTSAPPC